MKMKMKMKQSLSLDVVHWVFFANLVDPLKRSRLPYGRVCGKQSNNHLSVFGEDGFPIGSSSKSIFLEAMRRAPPTTKGGLHMFQTTIQHTLLWEHLQNPIRGIRSTVLLIQASLHTTGGFPLLSSFWIIGFLCSTNAVVVSSPARVSFVGP